MTVEEFARLVTIEADKFRDTWLREMKKDPELYPKTLGEGDWWEQFLTHLGEARGPRRR